MASHLRTLPCGGPRVCLPRFSPLHPVPGLPWLHLSSLRLPPLKGGVLFPFFPQFLLPFFPLVYTVTQKPHTYYAFYHSPLYSHIPCLLNPLVFLSHYLLPCPH